MLNDVLLCPKFYTLSQAFADVAVTQPIFGVGLWACGVNLIIETESG